MRAQEPRAQTTAPRGPAAPRVAPSLVPGGAGEDEADGDRAPRGSRVCCPAPARAGRIGAGGHVPGQLLSSTAPEAASDPKAVPVRLRSGINRHVVEVTAELGGL